MPDKLIPGEKRTMAYNKPSATKYVQPGIDPNTTAANIAAQQNVQPANTNPPPLMKTGPFKMKHNNSSFPFKSSPAKHWRKFSETTSDEEMQAVTEHNKHMRKPKNKNKNKK